MRLSEASDVICLADNEMWLRSWTNVGFLFVLRVASSFPVRHAAHPTPTHRRSCLHISCGLGNSSRARALHEECAPIPGSRNCSYIHRSLGATLFSSLPFCVRVGCWVLLHDRVCVCPCSAAHVFLSSCCCCPCPTVWIVSHTRATLRRMMMVTVRHCVACDLLVLALLCCCCLSVCRAAAPGVQSPTASKKPLADVVVLCPGTDGNLRWRFQGEEDWRKCARRPEEAPEDNGYCARLCNFAGDVYKEPEITRLCNSANNTSFVAFHMSFEKHEDLKTCSLGEAPEASSQSSSASSGDATTVWVRTPLLLLLLVTALVCAAVR
ncbi:Trypomastigote Alanine Serine and Valine rich protein (TASV) subfamily A [Trypanosoma cruzi]|uniref:Trypomastigote Alanine Serine and Valine rich protein (TASV) subfamily A n=1 Tax=Trypanosoma cruzi TaxID=5693 RepID=A0A7J6YAM7_TRYCR|nr:Trypomastigote Alanine Serine and Valine rich protein (TASV) subfamily A [Trypanosoma cruzi]